MAAHFAIPGETGHYCPPAFDRTATREAKGSERARLALLEAIKDGSVKDIPADNARGGADPVDQLLEHTEGIDLYIAASYALNGDKDAAVRKLVEIANKAAAAHAFAHSSAYEDGAW